MEHYTIGAGPCESRRLPLVSATIKAVMGEGQPAAEQSLPELADIKDPVQNDTRLIRLFDRAQTQVMTWLGAKGRVVTDAAILGVADAVIASPTEPMRAIGVLPQAFVSAIAYEKLLFDTSGAGILIGACDEARSFAAGISRLGLKKIMVVDQDDARTESLCNLLRKRLLGVEIVALARGYLTQVPAEASIAISLVGKNETSLLEDVSYLNFLKADGVFLDWTEATVELGLSEEIRGAGAQVFEEFRVRRWRDAMVLDAATGLKTDRWVETMMIQEAILLKGGQKTPSP